MSKQIHGQWATNQFSGPISPAPWSVVAGSPPLVRAVNGDNVANDVPNKPDARLIAAAPDLLAALENIAESGELAANAYPGDGWRLAHIKFAAYARAAIRKAKGE